MRPSFEKFCVMKYAADILSFNHLGCHYLGMKSQIFENLFLYETPGFNFTTLKIESEILKGNPLGDPTKRALPILSPIGEGPHPVIFILAGFTGNSPFYTNPKFNESNAVQVICEASAKGMAPNAHYVFVDSLTSWGGSQFINSEATGHYEDFIIQEVVNAVRNNYNCNPESSHWCIMGGSSGGYGALHLGSKFPEIFGVIAAIAPDSFFQASLLPEFYTAGPTWEKYGTARKILEDLKSGKIMKIKNWHSIVNAIAMAACYAPKGSDIEILFPLTRDGEVVEDVWNKFLTKDPIHFLKERKPRLHNSVVYLDVGQRDNFHLQYGARQIAKILSTQDTQLTYNEFDGNHFEIGERRVEVWKWLTQVWRQ